MKKYELFQNHIKRGDKITVVTSGYFGGMCVIPMVYDRSSPLPHYNNCGKELYGVEIICTPKGKRSLYKFSIDYNAPVIVYKGFVKIDADSIVYEKKGNVQTSRYTMNDTRIFTDCLTKHPENIIFHDIPTADVSAADTPTTKEEAD